MKLIPVLMELVGILGIGGGIGIELITGAGIGHLVITVSSAIVAIGAITWGKFLRGGRHGKGCD